MDRPVVALRQEGTLRTASEVVWREYEESVVSQVRSMLSDVPDLEYVFPSFLLFEPRLKWRYPAII